MITGNQKSILIIEDEPQFREELQRELKRKLPPKTKVHTAQNGILAISKFKKTPYNVVILDMKLGDGISGLDVFEELKQIREDFYSIALTAHSQFLFQAGKLDIDIHFEKPLEDNDYVDLVGAVKSFLKKKKKDVMIFLVHSH